MQEKVVELKTDDVWLLVNAKNIKFVEFERCKAPWADKFNLIIKYYDAENEEDVLVEKITEEDCNRFKLAFKQ